MNKPELPKCFHRRDCKIDGEVYCGSNRFVQTPGYVPESTCLRFFKGEWKSCPFADIPNDTESNKGQQILQIHFPPPPLRIRAQNVAKSIADLVTDGLPIDNKNAKQRSNICNSCEFKRGSNSCVICGCGLSLKQKSPSFHCPILKWPEDIEHELKNAVENVNTWAVGMTTTPRKNETLSSSIESVFNAGWNSINIFSEYGNEIMQDPRIQWHNHGGNKKLGAWNNFRMGLARLVANNPFASAYLMFQDDVRISKGSKKFLQNTLWGHDYQKIGIMSLYSSSVHDDGNFVGWKKLDNLKKSWGALAYIFTPYSVRMFVGTTTNRHRGSAGVDRNVGRFCKANNLEYWHHLPSLIFHTGETSTITKLGIFRARQCKRFVEDANELC